MKNPQKKLKKLLLSDNRIGRDKSLPDFVKLKKHPRPVVEFHEEGHREILSIVSKYFLEEKIYTYLINDKLDKYTNKGDDSSQDALSDAVGKLGLSEWAQVLSESLDLIESSQKPAFVKVNAFLQVLMLVNLKNNNVSGAHWDSVSPDLLARILHFLAKNSVGKDAWTVKSFNVAEKIRNSNLRSVEALFLLHKKPQMILSQLMQTNPEWTRFYQSLTSLEGLTMKSLVAKFEQFEDMKTPLIADYEEKILQELKKLPNSELFREELSPGVPAYISIVHGAVERRKRSPPEPKFYDALATRNKDFATYVMDSLENTLLDFTIPLKERVFALSSIRSLDYLEILPPISSRLEKAVLATAEHIIKARNYEDHHIDLSGHVLRIITKALAENSISKTQKLDLFRLISAAKSSDYTILYHGLENEINNYLKRFFSTLSKKEIDSVLLETLPNIQKIVDELKLDSSPLDPGKTERRFFQIKALEHNLNSIASGIQYLVSAGYAEKYFGMNSFNDIRNLVLAMARPYWISDKILTTDFKSRRIKGENSLRRGIHPDTSHSLTLAIIAKTKEAPKFHTWFEVFDRAMRLAGKGFMLSEEQRAVVANYVKAQLKLLTISQQYSWLRHNLIMKQLSPEESAEILENYLVSRVSRPQNRADLKHQIEIVLAKIKIKENNPDVFNVFRNRVAVKFNVQPSEIESLFPGETKTLTEQAKGFNMHIRGMSALAEFIRVQPVEAQLEAIEFLMARTSQAPPFVLKADQEAKNFSKAGFSPSQLFLQTRESLYYRSPVERTLVVNGILVGPNGLYAKPKGQDQLKNFVLKKIKKENQEVGRSVLDALILAEGKNASLVFSYILAQKNAKQNEALSEGLVLKSALDFYGVPGVKLGQYLAFSKDFEAYHHHFETYQDAAMPINYFEAIGLIQKRWGSQWDPLKYRIVSIKGSGSVNIAIEYEDLETKLNEIVSISRDDIEIKTQEDFRRFTLLVNALTSTPEREKYNFIVGLMGFIQKSVSLDFDKRSSFEMQKSVQDIYRRKLNGWQIQSVDAHEFANDSIRMQMAPGRGARKIYKETPEIYKDAMAQFLQTEFEILRGVDQSGSPYPVRLHANPDVHDGQVLIDVKNRILTILDFGQAVKITNEERNTAINFLRIITKVESVSSSMKLLGQNLDSNDLKQIFNRTERMDRFVHLISLLERNGVTVPIAVVHWVLAANRLIILGDKIGIPIEKSFRNLIITRKLGLPLSTYNSGKSTWDKFKNYWRSEAPVVILRCHQVFAN
ncbi:MAG: hypothetical protein SGJ18_06090 [Pseudomonadota bacterium]|nr:hypothetical protein [Pseudomonadota bacterium]